jgi:hypothetical protein
MTGWVSHVLLFLALAVPIVVLSAFFSEAEDGLALRSLPRRYAVFVGSCAIVAVVLLLLEHFFASVA